MTHAATRPQQRVGHIAYDDHRFLGESVFGELARRITEPMELIALAFGLPRLSAEDREVLRALALCTTSPDARVWPLKMTRTLASFGNPFAGFFGAQLAARNDLMGPGTTTSAAEALAWIRARVGDEPPADAVADAVAEWVAAHGRITGFGVPLRKYDERLLGLRRILAGHPATARPVWRLHEQVIEGMRAKALEPNLVLPFAALLLDLGLAPRRAGMFVTVITAHTFAAHALEAADQDGPWLRELPLEVIEDQSGPPRRSPATAGVAQLPPLAAAAVPRR